MFAAFDALTSILRMRNGEPNQTHYEAAEKHLKNLFKLWNAANLSFTPKVHSLLVHALEQVQLFQGIGDILEADIKHMHQISARIKSCVSRMKNKDQQALVHSRLEAITSNVEVITNIEERKIAAKCKIKSTTTESAENRAKRLKEERNERREQAGINIQETNYPKLTSKHEERKAKLLLFTELNVNSINTSKTI